MPLLELECPIFEFGYEATIGDRQQVRCSCCSHLVYPSPRTQVGVGLADRLPAKCSQFVVSKASAQSMAMSPDFSAGGPDRIVSRQPLFQIAAPLPPLDFVVSETRFGLRQKSSHWLNADKDGSARMRTKEAPGAGENEVVN